MATVGVEGAWWYYRLLREWVTLARAWYGDGRMPEPDQFDWCLWGPPWYVCLWGWWKGVR